MTNQEAATLLLPWLEKMAKGEEVQVESGGKWSSLDDWFLASLADLAKLGCLRVKPQPRRVWVNISTLPGKVNVDNCLGYAFATPSAAADSISKQHDTEIAVEFVEVIKEEDKQ